MATQELEISEASDYTQPVARPDDQRENASVVRAGEAVIQIDSMTSDLATDQLLDASDSGSQTQDVTLVNTEQDTPMNNTPSAAPRRRQRTTRPKLDAAP